MQNNKELTETQNSVIPGYALESVNADLNQKAGFFCPDWLRMTYWQVLGNQLEWLRHQHKVYKLASFAPLNCSFCIRMAHGLMQDMSLRAERSERSNRKPVECEENTNRRHPEHNLCDKEWNLLQMSKDPFVLSNKEILHPEPTIPAKNENPAQNDVNFSLLPKMGEGGAKRRMRVKISEPLTRISSFRKAQAEIQPSPARGEGKRVAFTLAEVLITLGIIGVVAAMTLPVITQKIEQIVLKNQFKKTYSTLSNLLKKFEAELGSKPECYYAGSNSYVKNDCTALGEFFEKNMAIAKKCTKSQTPNCIPDYKGVDDIVREENPGKPDEELNFGFCTIWNKALIPDSPAYILNDGSIVILGNFGGLSMMHILVDINGEKGPNKWGYDLFALGLGLADGRPSMPVIFTDPTSCESKREKGGVSTARMIRDSFLN